MELPGTRLRDSVSHPQLITKQGINFFNSFAQVGHTSTPLARRQGPSLVLSAHDRCCHRLDLLVCLILLENFCCASFKAVAATLPAWVCSPFCRLLLPFPAPCPNHILWPSLLANFYASSQHDGQLLLEKSWSCAAVLLHILQHWPSLSTRPLVQPAFLAASELIKLSSKLFFAFKRAWQTKCDC